MSDEEEVEWAITVGAWGNFLSIPAENAFLTVNGKHVNPPLPVEIVIETLFHLARASLDLFSEFDEEKLALNDELFNEYRKRSAQATMVLVGLGLGANNMSLKEVMMELLSNTDPEEIEKIFREED